jgi:hypothetical protein
VVRFDGDGVVVRLDGAAPPRLALELVHPTLESRDARIVLARTADAWRGRLVRPDSRMHVLLTDEAGTWRLTGTIDREATEVALVPGR